MPEKGRLSPCREVHKIASFRFLKNCGNLGATQASSRHYLGFGGGFGLGTPVVSYVPLAMLSDVMGTPVVSCVPVPMLSDVTLLAVVETLGKLGYSVSHILMFF